LEGRPSQEDLPESASLRFAVAHDADFLYVAARVTDPTPLFSEHRIVRDQDALSIVIDARPAPERDVNEGFFRARGSGSLEKLVIARLLPVEARDDPIFSSFLPALPEGTLHEVRATEDGYVAELAIPRAFLDERQGRSD
jgi:hypothetical protein